MFVTVAPAADSAGRLGRVKGSLRRSEFSDRVAPLTRPAPSLCPCHYRSDWQRRSMRFLGGHLRRKSPAISGKIGSRMPRASTRPGSHYPTEESESWPGTASGPRATPGRVVGDSRAPGQLVQCHRVSTIVRQSCISDSSITISASFAGYAPATCIRRFRGFAIDLVNLLTSVPVSVVARKRVNLDCPPQ